MPSADTGLIPDGGEDLTSGDGYNQNGSDEQRERRLIQLKFTAAVSIIWLIAGLTIIATDGLTGMAHVAVLISSAAGAFTFVFGVQEVLR